MAVTLDKTAAEGALVKAPLGKAVGVGKPEVVGARAVVVMVGGTSSLASEWCMSARARRAAATAPEAGASR